MCMCVILNETIVFDDLDKFTNVQRKSIVSIHSYYIRNCQVAKFIIN